jgi:hypothetical protein
MFIKNFIKVFGAVIGSAIVLPLSFGYSGALMLANTFKGFGSSGVNQWVSSTPNKISEIESNTNPQGFTHANTRNYLRKNPS